MFIDYDEGLMTELPMNLVINEADYGNWTISSNHLATAVLENLQTGMTFPLKRCMELAKALVLDDMMFV
eukprot:11071734-Lingulodinium_polyedra.AAC.1